MGAVWVILPHQLFDVSRVWLPIFKKHKPRAVVLLEDPVFFGDRKGSLAGRRETIPFNPLRLAYHKELLDAFWKYLQKKCKIPLYRSDALPVNLTAGPFAYCDPADELFERRWAERTRGSNTTVHDSPMFLASRADLFEFAESRRGKKLQHRAFFEWMKGKVGILEGVASQDSENRKRWREGDPVPPSPFDKSGKLPLTPREARAWLARFCTERFALFGEYQDAIVSSQPWMYHSMISPFLNFGLLTPAEVLTEIAKYRDRVPLNSYEGFVRQILGWREFSRFYYVTVSPAVWKKNALKAKALLSSEWWEGPDKGTKLPPILAEAIRDAWTYGYLHHIRRLMVVANWCTLKSIHPDDVYDWFMAFALDSHEWVMVFNIYSMGTYADGGHATRKPYVSSDAYLRRMSDAKAGPWEKEWNQAYHAFKDTNK